MWKVRACLLLVLALALAFPTEISACTNLDTQDTFFLTAPVDAGYTTCMNITASNVTFDCGDNLIQGARTLGGTSAISISEYGENITIRNCEIANFTYGLYDNGGDLRNFTAVNITLHAPQSYFFYLTGMNLTMTNLVFHGSYSTAGSRDTAVNGVGIAVCSEASTYEYEGPCGYFENWSFDIAYSNSSYFKALSSEQFNRTVMKNFSNTHSGAMSATNQAFFKSGIGNSVLDGWNMSTTARIFQPSNIWRNVSIVNSGFNGTSASTVWSITAAAVYDVSVRDCVLRGINTGWYGNSNLRNLTFFRSKLSTFNQFIRFENFNMSVFVDGCNLSAMTSAFYVTGANFNSEGYVNITNSRLVNTAVSGVLFAVAAQSSMNAPVRLYAENLEVTAARLVSVNGVAEATFRNLTHTSLAGTADLSYYAFSLTPVAGRYSNLTVSESAVTQDLILRTNDTGLLHVNLTNNTFYSSTGSFIPLNLTNSNEGTSYLVYNNKFYFNSTYLLNTSGSAGLGAGVLLNVSKTSGRSISGGINLGGNWYRGSYPFGSENCTDEGLDFICDSPFGLLDVSADNNATDFLPLATHGPEARNLSLVSDDLYNRTNGPLRSFWDFYSASGSVQVSNSTAWYRNGERQSALDDALVVDASYLSYGEAWRFTASVYDGSLWGDAASSGSLTVGSPPEQSAPVLNATRGRNISSSNITAYNQSTWDPQGFPVKNIFNWIVNGSSIFLLNMPFEGGCGSSLALDMSNSSYNASVYGALHLETIGHDGFGAYIFNGTTDYMDIANRPGLSMGPSGFTLSFWMRSNSSSATQFIISKNPSGGAQSSNYAFWYESGGVVKIYWGDNSTYDSLSTISTPNTWNMITFTYNSSDNRFVLYRNGTHVSNKTSAVVPAANTGVLRVGKLGGSAFFNGTLDDIIISNRTLTPEQVSFMHSGMGAVASSELRVNDVWQACITPTDSVFVGSAKCTNTLAITSDTYPPVILSISKSGTISPVPSNFTISSTTDKASTCWYKTSDFSASDTAGATMMDGANTTSQSFRIEYLANGTYGPYFISCRDVLGNNMANASSNGPINAYVTSIIFVNASGDDGTGEGTQVLPFRTLGYAIGLASEGMEVMLGAGNYRENSIAGDSLYIDKQLKITSLAGYMANISLNGSSIAGVFHINASNTVLDGLWINCTGSSATGLNGVEIDPYAAGVNVTNSLISDCISAGVSMGETGSVSSNSASIEGNTFINISSAGVYLQTGFGSSIRIVGNVFNVMNSSAITMNNRTMNGSGMGTGLWIENNTIYWNSTDPSRESPGAVVFSQIYNSWGATWGQENITIKGNTIGTEAVPFNGSGITMSRVGNYSNVTGNTVFMSPGLTGSYGAASGIRVMYVGGYCNVSGNTIGSFHQPATSAILNNMYTVYVRPSSGAVNVSLSNNTVFVGYARLAIFLEASGSSGIRGASIRANKVYARENGNGYLIGVGSESTTNRQFTYPVIEGNYVDASNCTGTPTHALFVGYTESANISNNYVIGGYYGYVIKGNLNATLINNTGMNSVEVFHVKHAGNETHIGSLAMANGTTSYNMQFDDNAGYGTCWNVTFRDCVFINTTKNAAWVRVRKNATVYMINTTYDLGRESVGDWTNLTRSWYLDVNVAGPSGSTVTIINSSGDTVYSAMGAVPRQTLAAYHNYGGARTGVLYNVSSSAVDIYEGSNINDINLTESMSITLNPTKKFTSESSSSSSSFSAYATSESRSLSSIPAGQTGEFSFTSLPVYMVGVKAVSDISNAKLTVADLGASAGRSGIPSGAGPAYSYLRISYSEKSGEFSGAVIRFQVSKSWVLGQGVTADDVALKRYADSWNDLPTRKIGENGAYYEYEADTPGFSYFAIGIRASSDSTITSASTVQQAAEPQGQAQDPATDDSPASAQEGSQAVVQPAPIRPQPAQGGSSVSSEPSVDGVGPSPSETAESQQQVSGRPGLDWLAYVFALLIIAGAGIWWFFVKQKGYKYGK
ncbi:MAG: LamG-like jellyroll fold domain-containing protein [Candidatus Bilamarchaeaceae archaeon]